MYCSKVIYSFVLFLNPKFIFLALAKTTTNIHNLSFLLIFVLGRVLNLMKGGDELKRNIKRDASEGGVDSLGPTSCEAKYEILLNKFREMKNP
jgi:hypothetical protein